MRRLYRRQWRASRGLWIESNHMKPYARERKVAEDLAYRAGVFVQKKATSLAIVSRKRGLAAFDFTTNQDMAAEKVIIAGLRQTFPGDAILSEESLSSLSADHPRLWIVDPLDGTKNYAHGLKSYGVAISLYERGAVQVAAVYLPVFDELYGAVRGQGVTLNGAPLPLREPRATLKESLVAVGFPHQRSAMTLRHTFRLCQDILLESTDILRTASAVFDTCTVAGGQVGGYITSPDIKPWDIASGMLFVEEQGGFVSDPRGRPLNLFRQVKGVFSVAGVMAKNKAIHRSILQVTKKYF